MKALSIFFGILLAIALTILWYFSDNIKGYYTFKEYCEKEGGLRVYEPLEKNVGWLADDKYSARAASLLGDIDFVRYTDKNGVAYDVKYLGGDPQKDSSFSVVVSDSEKTVKYQWNRIFKKIPNELRLSFSGYEVINFENKNTSVRYYTISYSRFDRARTILDAPSTIRCHEELMRSQKEEPYYIKKIKTAFEK